MNATPEPTASRPGAAVEFQHVSKRYGASATAPAALHDLSLSVAPGEICVLVGSSGCGKTTALQMVNRLVEPTEGRVLVGGQDVATVEPTALRRRIGYVIQQVGLFPHQTIAQNVATVPRLLGWPEARIQARVEELLGLIGLDPARVRDRYPAQLSGGERQRVGVARALAAEPPVLLMDEPFGAVDPIVRERLQEELLRLHAALGTTILFVTHDVDEALKLGHRVAVMQQGGYLAQYARPAELLARPASEFVERFVGADRGIKRLALMTVREAPLTAALATRLDAEGRSSTVQLTTLDPHAPMLVLDHEGHPRGWAFRDAAGAAEVGSTTPPLVVGADDCLRDALSTLLGATDERAVVVDAAGRYVGVLTLDVVARALRAATAEGAPQAPAPPPEATDATRDTGSVAGASESGVGEPS